MGTMRIAYLGYDILSPCLRALEESQRRMELERERLELLRMRCTGAVDVPDPEDGEDTEEMA